MHTKPGYQITWIRYLDDYCALANYQHAIHVIAGVHREDKDYPMPMEAGEIERMIKEALPDVKSVENV